MHLVKIELATLLYTFIKLNLVRHKARSIRHPVRMELTIACKTCSLKITPCEGPCWKISTTSEYWTHYSINTVRRSLIHWGWGSSCCFVFVFFLIAWVLFKVCGRNCARYFPLSVEKITMKHSFTFTGNKYSWKSMQFICINSRTFSEQSGFTAHIKRCMRNIKTTAPGRLFIPIMRFTVNAS